MSKHPSESRIWALGRGAPEPSVERHVESCRACALEARMVGMLHALRAAERSPCPTGEELVLLSEGMLVDGLVTSHVACCAACARQIESLHCAGRSVPLGHRVTSVVRQVVRAVESGSEALGRTLASLALFEMPVSLALTTRSSRVPMRVDVREEFANGMRRYREGDYEAARRDLERALERGEPAPELRFFLAAILRREGRHAAAAAMLERLVAERPLAEYRWHLAQAQLADGRGEQALDQLQRVARMPGTRRAAAKEQSRKVAEALAGE